MFLISALEAGQNTLTKQILPRLHLQETQQQQQPQQQQQQLRVYASVSVNATVREGASEEKGSCGMKLKAFNTVQLCRTPTTEERQNKSAEV